MNPIPRTTVQPVLDRFADSRVLVLGDLMLDRFVRGEVSRISPEAPVPVVRVHSRDDHLGGAGNVVANLRGFGAEVSVVAAVGADPEGELLRRALEELAVNTGGVLTVAGRPTTVKTRVLAQHQQVVRIDAENDGALSEADAARVEEALLERLGEVDALLVSDYAKGVVSPALLGRVLPEARRRGLTVTVDPKVPHMPHYQPATVVTPNQLEAAHAAGMAIRSDEDAGHAVRVLLDRLDVDAILMTRGEKGMLLARRDAEPLSIPTVAREVYDVTGAGDTVIAALTLGLTAGADLATAAALANQAASVVVGKLGTASCTREELGAALEREWRSA